MKLFENVWVNISFRAVLIYLVVLVGIRLTGKREVGQMAPFDLVLLLLIANAVQNAITGPDTSLAGGIIAAATLLLLNWIITRLAWESPKIRKMVEGAPTLLIHRGKLLSKNMAKEKITQDDLFQALREHGFSSLDEVDSSILEVDGSISVLRKDELPATNRPHHRFRLIRKK